MRVTFTLADVVLLVLLAILITLAVMSPRLRNWFALAGAVVAGVFLGKKGSELGAEKPTTPPDEDDNAPPPTIPDPTLDLHTDIADDHDAIDALPADDLADAWADHSRRVSDD